MIKKIEKQEIIKKKKQEEIMEFRVRKSKAKHDGGFWMYLPNNIEDDKRRKEIKGEKRKRKL